MTDEALELIPYTFSNKPEDNRQYLEALLVMFYEGAFHNRLGVMEAFDLTTNEETTILVGVEADEDGKPVCYPVARCLKAEEVKNFLAPDGKGGYYDPHDPVEASEARENLKPIKEAVELDGTE